MEHGQTNNQDPGKSPGNGALPEVSTVAASPAAQAGVGRYLRREFHARGGLGEVWRSEDAVLGREVALKVLRHDGEPTRVRFEAEAQITGQLEHPNIVPVHDLGRDEDGQPFYIMKFVRGRTLKSVIAQFHSPSSDHATGRQVQWVRLLQIFIDVCHAVAYAHSRGVIHRDLKPDNVMLGSYGETLVLDWGLAKLLHGAMVAGEAAGESGGSEWCKVRGFDSGSATGEGTVLGTPSYMAPEMADGHASQSDRRTDIYLLGATLYEIITGQLPRRGSSREEIVELARTVPPPPARRVRSACPRPLEAIAAKAMAQRPEDRYASVMALAEEVQRYLADEPVSVCPESRPRRAWRWCKRHRTAIGRTSVAMVSLGLLVAAVMSAKALDKARKQDEARKDLVEFRRHAGQSLYFAANADLPAERTPYYDQGRGREEIEQALHVTDLWGPRLDQCPLPDQLPQLRREMYSLLLLGAQLNNQVSGPPQETRQMLDRAAMMSATPTRGYHRILSETYKRGGDLKAAESEMQLATAPDGPADADDLFLQGEKMRQQTADSSEPAKRFELLHTAITDYKETLHVDPSHYWAHFQLGRCQLALGNPDEAASALGTCIALHPEQPWGYSARGLAFALARRYPEAHRDLDKALERDPAFQPARMNLGVCYWLQKEYAKARESFELALNPPLGQGLPEAACYLGRVSLEQRQFQQAVADCSRALTDRQLPAAYACRAIAYLLLADNERGLADLDSYALTVGVASKSEDQKHAVRGDILVHWPEDWPSRDTDRAVIRKLAASELAKANESSAMVWTDRGLASADDSQTIACFGRSLEIDPRNAKTWAYLGEAHDRRNDHRTSANDFIQATLLAPADAMSHAWLGYEYTLLGAREDALREAAQAMELAENDYRAIVTVACIHARLSQLDPLKSQQSRQQLDSTVAALRHATNVWHTTLSGPDLVQLILNEESFKIPQLTSRDDFRALDPAINNAVTRMQPVN